MADHTDELLAQLVELQRRQLAAQEAALENQRRGLERQERALRRHLPLFLALVVLIFYGPYWLRLALYYLSR